MSRYKGSVIARLAVVATVAISSAFLAVGCGGDEGDDGGNPGGNSGGGEGTTVTIGGKKWMSKNLDRVTADSWCYGEGGQDKDDNSDSYITLSSAEVQANCAKYGRLYTWDAAKTACPSPWRLPTREDWDALVIAADGTAGSSATGAPNLKDQSWDNGANTTGFSALPGGSRHYGGSFTGIESVGYWWAATEFGYSYAYHLGMNTGNANVGEYVLPKSYGFSVRCLQD
jgi:uncharacterized protein (TIGR02145 family)